MSQQHIEPSFSSTDAVDVAQYARVSRLSIAALILGLLSAAALYSQMMWCLPAAGAMLAIAARRSIARSEDVVSGRRAAVIGLVLSLLFGAWAAVRFYARERVLSQQAREHAEQWIDFVREGRLYEAHQLRLTQHERQPPDADLAEYYETDEMMGHDFNEFCGDPSVKKIAELGDTGRVRYVRDEEFACEAMHGSRLDIVTQEYAVDYEEDGEPRSVPVLIGMARVREYGAEENFWYVRGVKDPNELEE
jgi:hypothetical protein